MSATLDPSQPENGHALAYWEPRRALTLDAARRHSAFIRLARRVLIGLSVLLVVLLIWYFVQTPKRIEQTDNPDEAVRMEHPIYKGRTQDSLPFKILADYAVRLIKTPDEVKLTKPVLEFYRNEKAEKSLVLAETGVYNSKAQVLELRADVDLKTDDGYACQTSHARVFVQEKRIEGDETIACSGSFGQTKGHAYEINDNYREFVFKKGMSARIIPKKADEAAGGSGNIAGPTPDINPRVSFGGDAPIDVNAVKAIYRGGKTQLHGQVDVRQNDGRILADEMDLLRKPLPSETDAAQKYGYIETIVARGHFKYETPKSSVTGDKGVYERDKNTITVTGNVRYTESGGNTAKGERMVYDLTKDRVFLGGGNGKVELKIGQD